MKLKLSEVKEMTEFMRQNGVAQFSMGDVMVVFNPRATVIPAGTVIETEEQSSQGIPSSLLDMVRDA